MGKVKELRGVLPGIGEGIWYTITIDGVEFYYARYDEIPDRAELMGSSITSGEYSLANGISVGMTKQRFLIYAQLWQYWIRRVMPSMKWLVIWDGTPYLMKCMTAVPSLSIDELKEIEAEALQLA